MTGSALRVGLVDDHAVVRAGYRRFLEEEGIAVVMEAADADEAYEALGRTPWPPVDILVVDLALRGRSGLDLIHHVRHRWPDVRLLVFSMHDDPGTVTQCLRAGAAGFISKSSEPDILVDAVRQAARGQAALSPDIADRMAFGAAPPHAALGLREFDVLNALLDGDALESIAQRLHLSPKTVANYQTSIRQKLGVATAAELLEYARRHGLRG